MRLLFHLRFTHRFDRIINIDSQAIQRELIFNHSIDRAMIIRFPCVFNATLARDILGAAHIPVTQMCVLSRNGEPIN